MDRGGGFWTVLLGVRIISLACGTGGIARWASGVNLYAMKADDHDSTH